MFSSYVSGIPSGSNYNLLVSGGSAYTSSSGVMIKSDTTASGSGNKGLAITHSSSDNANIDFRTSKGGSKSITMRIQDDSAPSNYINALSLTDDDKSSVNVFGATIGGRLKASQFHSDSPDTRDPILKGLYLGHDNSNRGYVKINKGTDGIGGMVFETYNQNASLSKRHLELLASGYLKMPEYSSSGNIIDTEDSAIASFDSTGKLVRNYEQNARFRSVEDRLWSMERTSVKTTPARVNEIVRRMNSLHYFNTSMTELDVSDNSFEPTKAARYIRFEFGNAPGSQLRYLHFRTLKVFTSGKGANIISPSTASATASQSYHNEAQFSPDKVLDNNDATRYESEDYDSYPWLEVDLKSDIDVYKIEVLNRAEIQERFAGIRVILKNSAGTVIWTSNLAARTNGSTQSASGMGDGYNYYSYWPGVNTTAYGSQSVLTSIP